MIKWIFTYALCFGIMTLAAQSNSFNNWHFGNKAAITFNTNPASYVPGSVINTLESCGAISDTNGVLRFYTDGIRVYNKNHQQMPNGFGLNGHTSSTQGAFIVPYPKHPDLYYIFTMDAQDGALNPSGCACLSYSMVDMSLAGGLGNVASKNNLLYLHVTEKLAGYFSTDTSIWVVAHEWGSNKFLSYSISPSGLNTTPVISTTGFSHCCDPGKLNATGQMKLSSDGTKLGYVLNKDNKLEILFFDKVTGIVSHPVGFQLPYQYLNGFEFAPNGNSVYLSSSFLLDSYLLQYDIFNLDSLAIKASEKIIDHNVTGTYTQLQLGVDGKIYVAENNEYFLSVINSPNQSGVSCNFSKRSLSLSDNLTTGESKVGLPNVIWGYGKRAPEFAANDSLCDPSIPNVMTPNNDLANDEFKITCYLKTFSPEDLVIYNRWGEMVLNKQKKTDLLKVCPDGVYFYVFTLYGKKYSGFVTLFH